MLEKLLLNNLKDITIPYEQLKEIKISVDGVVIPLEDFIELKIKQVLQGDSDEGTI